jgi:hypothetical protein
MWRRLNKMAIIVSFPFIGMQTALVITTSIKGFKHLIGKKLHTVFLEEHARNFIWRSFDVILFSNKIKVCFFAYFAFPFSSDLHDCSCEGPVIVSGFPTSVL